MLREEIIHGGNVCIHMKYNDIGTLKKKLIIVRHILLKFGAKKIWTLSYLVIKLLYITLMMVHALSSF